MLTEHERQSLVEILRAQHERGNVFNMPSIATNYPEFGNVVRMRADQRLCVSVFSTLKNVKYQGNALTEPTFNISGLFIAIDGSVVQINDQLKSWDGLKTIKLGDGFLIWVNVQQFSPTTWNLSAKVSISIRADRGDSLVAYAYAPRRILAEGWCSPAWAVSYPSQKQDTSFEQRVQVVCLDDPLAGTDLLWYGFSSSGAGKVAGVMDILQVRFQVTTAAVGVARTVGVFLISTDNIPAGGYLDRATAAAVSQTNQNAGTTRIYFFQQNAGNYVLDTWEAGGWTSSILQGLPSPFAFSVGDTAPGAHTQFRIAIENIDAGDQISKTFITYRLGDPVQAQQ